MGLKDVAAKNFFGRPDVLAELLDFAVFDGKAVMRQSRITDLCGEHLRIVRAEGGGYRTDNSYRDKLFECDLGGKAIKIGVEYQSRNDRKMVPRMMKYNARLYSDMSDEGVVRKVGNIVLSFDRNRKSKSSLLQMVGGQPCVYDRLFFDYGYISLNIYDIAEKLDMFPCGELNDVLYLFKCVKENRPFMADIAQSRLKRMRRMSRDAALVCEVFLGLKLEIADDAEVVDVCNEVRRFERECIKKGEMKGLNKGLKKGREEGRQEGRKEGLIEGEMEAVKRIVKRLWKKSLGILEICDYTGASEETVREIVLSLES